MSEQAQLEEVIAALESQRAILGDVVVETALASLREKLATLKASTLPEQRKLVTILLADVSGFTALAESMDPEEVRDLMHALWTRIDEVILAHGGTIDKHIGDAVMALFGAPTAQADDPERAVRAALAIQAEVQSFRESGPGAFAGRPPGPMLQMRVGVHTGQVLLGTVGTTARSTAVGDTVTLVDWIQRAAPVGGVLISRETYRHVRALFELQEMPPVEVLGGGGGGSAGGHSIGVYLVGGFRQRAFRTAVRGIEGIVPPLVGRRDELATLQAALDHVVTTQQPHIVTVVGEAGIGKSRLLWEFTNWIEQQAYQVVFFKGRASQGLRRLPYALIRDFLASYVGIRESDRAAVAREKLEQGVLSLLGSQDASSPQEPLERAHFIGHLIGLDFSASPYLEGILYDPRQIHDRAFYYIAQFLKAAATPHTDPQKAVPAPPLVVLLLEDIHWADDGSLDLIEYIGRTCREVPILVVGLARPALLEHRLGWGADASIHTRLVLGALAKEQSRHLVEAMLHKIDGLPVALRELVVGGAEGNPFYMEELIKVLIEEGVIVVPTTGESWWVRPERLVRVRVPPTLLGVLQARLDALPLRERTLLQQAAVIGRTFWDSALVWLQSVSDPFSSEPQDQPGPSHIETVTETLAALEARGLILLAEPSAVFDAREYTFKNAMLYEVTYESVLLRLRRRFHAQIAIWLIEHSGERLERWAGLIGEHFERAGERIRAAEWYGRAGKQAQDTYAQEEARRYYQRALMFLATARGGRHMLQRIEYSEGLGILLWQQARYREAVEAFEAMRAAAENASDLVAQARAWNHLAAVMSDHGQYQEALVQTEQAEALALLAESPAECARALLNRGTTLFRLGRAEDALPLAQQVLASSPEDWERRLKARSLNLLAQIHGVFGQYEASRDLQAKALNIFEELGDRRWTALMLNNLGENRRMHGDLKAAVSLYQRGLTIAQEIGDRDSELVLLSNLGGVQVALGDYKTAEQGLRHFVAQPDAAGWFAIPESYYFLAGACLGQNKVAAALDAATQSLWLGEERGSRGDMGRAWRMLGQIASHPDFHLSMALPTEGQEPLSAAPDDAYHSLRAKLAAPEACFTESAHIFAGMGADGERAHTLEVWARYHHAQGDEAQAKALWQEARMLFARLGVARPETL